MLSLRSLRFPIRSRCSVRFYASPSNADHATKPKPKSVTPLRRAASASLPIRSNPTPTRSEIQTVFTLATAERYILPRLKEHLPPTARRFHESWWIPNVPGSNGNTGEVFVFGNGSSVCWGLNEEDASLFASSHILKSPATQVGPLKEPETEQLEFVMDPTENTRLQGDLIILGKASPPTMEETLPSGLPSSALPSETLLARYAFSQALSRSTALSALEVSLDDYLSSMALLPHSLEQTGRPGLGRMALIKKLGELMKFRQGLILNRENFFDTPDFYWAEPQLEAFFHSVIDALEVKGRTTSVNDKITYAAEAQSVLRQLLTESSTHRMELVIIALIAVEVVIALIRDGPELWHMLTGAEPEENSSNN